MYAKEVLDIINWKYEEVGKIVYHSLEKDSSQLVLEITKDIDFISISYYCIFLNKESPIYPFFNIKLNKVGEEYHLDTSSKISVFHKKEMAMCKTWLENVF